MFKRFVLAAILVSAAFVVLAQDNMDDQNSLEAIAVLMGPGGEFIGEVFFTQETGYVFVNAYVQGLEPGFHGFHIHTTGECDASTESPFTSAGGHWNLEGTVHPNHTGDLPTLLVMADGTGYLATQTDRFTVDQMFDEDGTGFIIHAVPDNFANVPERYGTPDEATLATGDAANRVACGVVKTLEDGMVG